MASKSKAKDKASSAVEGARPYVQRLIEDEELRDNLREAYDAGRNAYSRASGAKKPSALLDDKKLQEDLKSASESLRAVSDALREPEKMPKSGGHPFLKLLVHRIHRRDPGDRPERGPAQGHPRPALRRRGGVRVQLHDLAARPDKLSTPGTKRPKGPPAAGETRELSGDSAGRIVDAMREAVATRGIAGATFEHVAAQAGVSRGLLHYYFGTKERLLVEVVRRDSESRVQMLDGPLHAAADVDGVLDVLVSSLVDLIENDPGFFIVLFELFAAGRRNEEIGREVGALFRKSRDHVARALDDKHAEGVIELRFGAEATVSYLFAIADGLAVQALSDPDRDQTEVLEAGRATARQLFVAG